MLQSIRDGLQSQKWLMYIVLGLLALIFAAWGAYGLVNFNGAGSTYAAEAGGQKVSIESARTAWLNQQTQYQQVAQIGGFDRIPFLMVACGIVAIYGGCVLLVGRPRSAVSR